MLNTFITKAATYLISCGRNCPKHLIWTTFYTPMCMEKKYTWRKTLEQRLIFNLIVGTKRITHTQPGGTLH